VVSKLPIASPHDHHVEVKSLMFAPFSRGRAWNQAAIKQLRKSSDDSNDAARDIAETL
jgi:hypothetical protein